MLGIDVLLRTFYYHHRPHGPNRTGSHSSSSTTTAYPPYPTRVRRSQSSSSALSSPSINDPSSISYGIQNVRLVAPSEKKPSRHADVIDQWDLTGVGKSMWHHSGPYDAAAPSRNDAKERAGDRAPMAVFGRTTELDGKALASAKSGESGVFLLDEPVTAGSAGSAAGIPGRKTSSSSRGFSTPAAAAMSPREEKKLPLSPDADEDYLPALPASATTPGTNKPRAYRHLSSPGVVGSLQEEYSQSLPNSGGYFSAGGTKNEGVDERRVRQREREQKRKALQAAWGIDERECR